MSLAVALNTSLSGLLAQQQAIAATSENIANVNTPNFSRRDVQFSTDAIADQFAGVTVDIARAETNRFLQGAAFDSASAAGSASAIAEALSRIEASLGAPGQNISFSNEFDNAFAALTELSAAPNSFAARASALSALDAAFSALARTQAAIAGEDAAAASELESGAARASVLLNEIFRLNQAAPNSNGAADQLDARLQELSGLLSVNVTRNSAGQVSVSTAGGQVLADASGFASIASIVGPPAGLAVSGLSDAPTQATIALPLSDISEGRLGGLVQLRSNDLQTLGGALDTVASDIAGALNAAYAQNVAVGDAAPTTTPLVVQAADGLFAVNPSLIADPSLLALARPSSGQTGGANDGLGAAALAAVSETTSAGNVRDAVAQIGEVARTATLASNTNTLIADDFSARIAGEGGVNLDEELSNLILYQNAFNANARVIAAVDELWQSILSIL